MMTTALQILAAPPTPNPGTSPAEEVPGLGSPAMQRVMALGARVAPLDLTVLISGETGVGKERLARWLHQASPRAHRPFVAINCGALVDTLLDTELFGHVRGAFTGAVHDQRGVFEVAHTGTLFLDEIAELSPSGQVKLLRVLEEREIRRVGDTATRRVDVRVMVASHRNLAEEMAQRRLRADLYYRLRVIDLHVPPLRDRPEDLQALARTFLARAAARTGRPIVGFAPEAWKCVVAYGWPGNIRELEHAVERACALADGFHIEVLDLPHEVTQEGGIVATGASAGGPSLRMRERAYVQSVLARHHGNRVRAAEELHISLSTLKRRIRPGWADQ
jgi:transcriptional regulator with PAS, ATPase and Fis domain